MTSLFLFINLLSFSPVFNQEIVLEEEVVYEEVIAVGEEEYVGINDENSYLYFDNNIYTFEGYLVSSLVESVNSIYLCCNSKSVSTIITFNKFNKTTSYQTFEDIFIEKIYDINSSIYLIGSIDNNGLILNLDYELNILSTRCFEGDGKILVNNLLIDDYIYLSIYKDGITNNSEFINHGNYLDKKSILVKLDFEYRILNTYYIDEDSTDEVVINLLKDQNTIKFLLKTSDKYYIYKLDSNLNNSKYYSLKTTNDIELIMHYKSTLDDLIIDKTNKELLRVNKDDVLAIKEFSDYSYIFDYKIIDGNLFLYGSNNCIKITKFDEYEVIKNEVKTLNIFNLDYLNTSNIVVESWFELLNIKVCDIEPYFEKTKHGTYNVTYLIEHQDMTVSKINGEIKVESFTNFIDNGVYKVGKVLEFFGTANLSGETIYYGTLLNECGEYDIEITDVNNHKTLYHIYIVDDYYKEEKVINTSALDIYQNTAFVNVDTMGLEVLNVIVDDQVYNDYQIIDNTLIIRFPKSSDVLSFYFNGITFNNNGEEYYYSIEKNYTFNYIKTIPSIYLNPSIEETNLNLRIDVGDSDKTFMYLKAVSSNKEEIITSNYKITDRDVKLYLVYNLGNNKLQEVLISNIIHNIPTYTDIIVSYENGSLSSININYEINKQELKELNINDTSYIDYYKYINNPSFLPSAIITSIIILLVVGISFSGYLIVKKIKNNIF